MEIIPIYIKNDPAGWHALRRKHIGASDVAALFNCGNSYTPTLNALYHEKRGNLPPETKLNLLAELGKAMEPFIAFVVSDIHGWRLEPCAFYHEHPEYPWLGCSLDYFVVESEHGPGVMQIKNVQQWAPGWTQSRAPDHVELQVQHEYLVCNAARVAEGLRPFTWGCIASLHSGNPEDVRVMLRKPEPKVHKHIIERTRRFMDDVAAGREPPLIGAEEYGHINDMFKFAEEEADPDPRDLRGDAILDDYVAEWIKASGEKKGVEQRVTEMKTRILHRMLAEAPQGGKIWKRWAARTDNYAIQVQKNGAIKVRPVGEA
jgi:putative phage-type endonuclease